MTARGPELGGADLVRPSGKNPSDLLAIAAKNEFLCPLPKHRVFSLWFRKGKVVCKRAFALHRQQPEKDCKMLILESFLRTPMTMTIIQDTSKRHCR